MKKLLPLSLSFLFLFLIYPNSSRAAIDLSNGYWETTFDCDTDGDPSNGDTDWLQYSDPLVCDGLGKWLGGTDSCGNYEQITPAANNLLGTGKGQRHWVGDGVNNNSGGINVNFDTPQPELWIRWYMRYEAGFEWNPLQYDKILYLWLRDANGNSNSQCIPEWYGFDQFNLGAQAVQGGLNYHSPDGTGWTNTMGGSASDGKWHWFEVHLKIDTDGTDGVGEVWIDDTKILNRHNLDWEGYQHVGWGNVLIGSNQRYPNNGGCMAVDFDDLAISTTGYIGPINSTPTPDTTPPTRSNYQPTGTLPSGTAQAIISLSTDENSTCKYDTNAGISYSSMTNTFSTTGGTNHSQIITGLTDGNTYNYYVRCQDASNNQNTSDYITSFSVASPAILPSTTLFTESFDDSNFTGRNWYDGTNLKLSTTEKHSGNSSVEYHFPLNATTPEQSGGAIRQLFTDTDEVYVSYYIKHSSNWTGSNRAYHPHEFLLLTNENGAWDGPAYTHLTAYIEENEGTPQLGFQDGQNINLAQLNVDLTNTTETRSTSGCNGVSSQENASNVSCYPVGGGIYWNGKTWKANQIYFSDTPGPYYKNDWHKVEAYFKLNTISGGKGQSDGIVQYWYDGQLIINKNNITMRTAQYPNMKFNQFMIAPWIGDGSPVDQTMWIDDLTVATSRPTNTSIIRADVDQNSSINITDALLTLRNSLGLDMSSTNWQTSNTTGDVNCDGNSNSIDAMLILKYSLGLSMTGTAWCEGS